ncbi:MAG: hypothetical protein IJE04_01795 [Bacilli bacterium]|nr:hypothetical protein [Bacilli bacterium]
MKNIVITILAMLVLGLGGFLVYDKIIDKEEETPIENGNHENGDSAQGLSTNSYKNFSKKLKEQFSKYNLNNYSYQYIENGIIKDGYVVYLDSNGSLFVKYNNVELNNKYGNYKIADNVLSFYAINVGQDVGNVLYFINADGSVGSADTEYGVVLDNQLLIRKDLGYKNIVSIVNGTFGDGLSNVHGPIFIDIDGNIFSDNLK